MNNLIELGSCRRPHGIKGAFSFFLINQVDSVLVKGSLVTLLPLDDSSSIASDGIDFEISSINFGNKTIVQLTGVTDRNTVEAMIPFSILIKREALPELEDGSYYLSDLIGLDAVSYDDEQIGRVIDIGSNSVQDILYIQTDNEVLEVLLIDSFVKDINWSEKRIVIVVPEFI